MKNTNLNLPASCSVISEDEMLHIDGGFELTLPIIAGGAAVVGIGAMALNMLSWFKGDRETNFIQDTINFGQNFINGSLEFGQNLLNSLMGK